MPERPLGGGMVSAAQYSRPRSNGSGEGPLCAKKRTLCFKRSRSPDIGNLVQDVAIGTVDQQDAVVDPYPAAVVGRPGQAIRAVIIHDIAHEIARQIIARMPAVLPILPRHAVITEARCEEEVETHAVIIPESVISAPPVAVALPHRAAVPVLIGRLPLVCLLDMTRRYGLIAAKCLDLWSRLNLRLVLGAERPLRVGLPLLSVKALRLLPFRPCLRLDGGGLDLRLSWRLEWRLRLLSLLSLLSLRHGLRLDRSLNWSGLDLRLFSLLPLLPLRPGLRLDRSLGLGGRHGRRRLNLCTAAMSAFALVRPGLLLLRIWRPVLMFAASPIVRLGQRGRRTRNQNGNGSRNKSHFHEITQSMNGGLQNRFGA